MDKNINSSVLAYVQNDHIQFLLNACLQAYEGKKYNTCCYLVYSYIYNKSHEEILNDVNPDLLVMYSKSIKKIRGGGGYT